MSKPEREIEYFPYRPEHRTETIALMDRVQEIATSVEEFEWWFHGNPGGETNLLLARMDGAIVGVNSLTPYRMRFPHGEETVGFPQKICVDESTRGRGVFLKMQKRLEQIAIERGCRLFLGFPNGNAYPIWINKWGCMDLPPQRLWLRVENPAPLLRRTGVPGWLAEAAGLPYRKLVSRRPARAPAKPRGGIELRALDAFDAQADTLFERAYAARRGGLGSSGMMVRSAAYLNWRYFRAPPPRSYRAVGIFLDGRLEGYAVAGVLPKGGFSFGGIAELFFDPDSGVERQLLDAGLDLAAAMGADAVGVMQPFDLGARALLATRGFVPTPRRFPVIGKSLVAESSREELHDRRALRFSLGDLDFF